MISVISVISLISVINVISDQNELSKQENVEQLRPGRGAGGVPPLRKRSEEAPEKRKGRYSK